MTNFHKSAKWETTKTWFITNLLRKTYGRWIPFCFFFQAKMINLPSFLWNIKILKPCPWRFVNGNCTVHKLLFLKKNLTCVSFGHKDLKKHFKLTRLNIKKNFWIHLETTKISSTRDEKWNWHFIRNNSKCFECLAVSLFRKRFLLWLSHHF